MYIIKYAIRYIYSVGCPSLLNYSEHPKTLYDFMSHVHNESCTNILMKTNIVYTLLLITEQPKIFLQTSTCGILCGILRHLCGRKYN